LKRLVFSADVKTNTVEALNLPLDAKPIEVQILINGIDISESVKLEKIEIYIVKEEKK